MTVSGASCRNDIKSCSNEDQEVNRAMNQSLERSGEKKAERNVTPNGPGFVETKKEQGMGVEHLVKKASPTGIAKKLAEKGALHVAEEALKRGGMGALARGLSIAGWAATGVEVATHLHKAAVDTAREMGQELHEGNLRDAQNVAILRMASPKLPKEYVKRELDARSRAADHAKKIETVLQSRPPAAYMKLVQSVQKSAQSGIDAAKQAGIDSEAKLAQALKTNADFAKAYDSNTAFRHGVRSQIR